MTTSHLILMTSLYLVLFVGVAYWTRARVHRVTGAICGGAVVGVVALLAISLGEAQGWWRVPEVDSLHFRSLLWVGVAGSCAPVYLITWRVARRFGGRGLALFALAAAIIGPPRDYLVAATFPDWIAFAPGIAPVLAVATFYALLVLVGHTVMRIISGPAQGDLLR